MQRQLRELKRQVDQGGVTEQHKITVAEFFDQWLQDCAARGLAYATMLFRAGEHPKIVSERLGHSSIALTLDTYTHHVPGLDDDTAAKVQRLIRPNTPGQPDGSPGRIGPNIGPKGTDDGSPSDVGESSPSGSGRADGQIRTGDQLFTKQLLYP